jgi:hypothetical protein
MRALSQAPGKVRLIAIGDIAITKTDEGVRNKRFQEYVLLQSLFRDCIVSTEVYYSLLKSC